MHNIFFIYIFLFRGKRGGSALNIFSIFYTHHRIPNKHMMTINFDTITNNHEVIYVIKTVMKYYLKKIDTSLFSSPSSKYGSTFICWRHYMTRFGLWIFMSKITHDFWLCIFCFMVSFCFVFVSCLWCGACIDIGMNSHKTLFNPATFLCVCPKSLNFVGTR